MADYGTVNSTKPGRTVLPPPQRTLRCIGVCESLAPAAAAAGTATLRWRRRDVNAGNLSLTMAVPLSGWLLVMGDFPLCLRVLAHPGGSAPAGKAQRGAVVV